MKQRLFKSLVWLLLPLVLIPGAASGQENRKTLTIWLIPLELAATDQTMDFDKFNEKAGAGGWVSHRHRLAGRAGALGAGAGQLGVRWRADLGWLVSQPRVLPP